jgi:hypothetical protein
VAALLLSRAPRRTRGAQSNRRGELKELIANLVWEDEGHDLHPDRFVHVDSGVDAGYDLGDEIERFVSEGYDLDHYRFRQGSLRFEMLRARE